MSVVIEAENIEIKEPFLRTSPRRAREESVVYFAPKRQKKRKLPSETSGRYGTFPSGFFKVKPWVSSAKMGQVNQLF